MDNSLPSEFDLIVVGTGFTESIVAAAASRVGKNVLHLDTDDFYGGQWASFSLKSLIELQNAVETHLNESETTVVAVDDLLYVRKGPFRLTNATQHWSDTAVDTKAVSENTDALPELESNKFEPNLKEAALQSSRRFNIDLTPKLMFARGELVELLISSNICRYSEFRAVDCVMTQMDGLLKRVPCSRSDIFTSKEVSVIEKRLLSKCLLALLNMTDDDPVHDQYAERTFREYLLDNRLSENLVHYVLHAIAMCAERASFAEGARRTKKFLMSTGRYGTTPFLFTMYGCGEIPQCFCRLCAVFGGTYCLKRSIDAVHRNADGHFEAITSAGQRIQAKNIVFGPDTLQCEPAAIETGATVCATKSRAILLTKSPLVDIPASEGGGGVTVLKLPSLNPENAEDIGAHVLQLSHYSGTCPNTWYLIHLTCLASDRNDPESDCVGYIDQIFKSSEARESSVVWSMYFSQPACAHCTRFPGQEKSSSGIHYTCGSYFELDYDRSIQEARDLFTKMFENEEFLPRAPDPEEIVMPGSEEDNGTSENHDETVEKKTDDAL